MRNNESSHTTLYKKQNSFHIKYYPNNGVIAETYDEQYTWQFKLRRNPSTEDSEKTFR
jgi:hypothetical protein